MKKLNLEKKPTWTCKVMELLTGRDDFMTMTQIREGIGCNCNQVSAALIHLRRRQAVDCVIEPNGIAWWFSTAENDDRSRHCDERVPEEPGSRCPRKSTTMIKLQRGGVS